MKALNTVLAESLTTIDIVNAVSEMWREAEEYGEFHDTDRTCVTIYEGHTFIEQKKWTASPSEPRLLSVCKDMTSATFTINGKHYNNLTLIDYEL